MQQPDDASASAARPHRFFESAAALDPDFPRVQSALGVAYFNARRFQEATAALTKAVAQRPDDAGSKRMLALSLINTEAWEKAAPMLLRDDPERATNASLQLAYGVALARTGRGGAEAVGAAGVGRPAGAGAGGRPARAGQDVRGAGARGRGAPQLRGVPETEGPATLGAPSETWLPRRRPLRDKASTAAAADAVLFRDVTREAGITFQHHSAPDKKYIVESMSGGVALFDFDNDGLLDIYLVDSLTVDTANDPEGRAQRALPEPRATCKFEDVTDKAGVGHPGWGMGVCTADVDGDGWEDLYVTALGGNTLYRNNHDGTFTDVDREGGRRRAAAGPRAAASPTTTATATSTCS